MATGKVAIAPMKAARISHPGGDFEIFEQEIPKPNAGEVLIKVQACGVCHSDAFTKDGSWPGIQYPRIPGHEVVGLIDELGDRVTGWKTGQRVGVGWHGGHDGTCRACQRGDFRNCQNLKVPGISYDGGYQEYMVAPVEAVVAIQFANKFGYNVAAIGRGSENEALAKNLGASTYIDSKSTNAAEALQKLGGAQVILATAPNSKAMSELFNGLGPNGKLMVIGAAFDPIEVTPVQLISGSRAIQGWASGTTADEEDTLHFAALKGVRPMIETYPLEKAGEAYARMMSGKAQFRVVLTMEGGN
jgi:D-arabinose 1-dehydrogenase-like Zn-dependent alcohol dehydrogenase